MAMTGDTAALAGLKVVEFAHVIAGPLAGTPLADLPAPSCGRCRRSGGWTGRHCTGSTRR